MVPTINKAVNHAAAARSKLHSVFTYRLKTQLKVYGAYVRSRLTYAAPALYELCFAHQVRGIQIHQNRFLRLIVGAPRYVRNVIHGDTRMPIVEENVCYLARTMFARADKGVYTPPRSRFTSCETTRSASSNS
ncbi:unnamed protein product [Euphydryas editha]|uniref:Uncharacterized protein n=1 Tax=Euphydryas editha TaxID=104508 RepID=A0AAU9TTP9_EUPED|nr:unnamed protein product [Euphydryas editha]CAH2089565.1 unnamed protein product [Euphydryas editha]